MFPVDLNWHKFNIDLSLVSTYMQSRYKDLFVELCANNRLLTVNFKEISLSVERNRLTREVTEYWNSLSENSMEAASYTKRNKSVSNAKESAKTKLYDLGFTQEEINAIFSK